VVADQLRRNLSVEVAPYNQEWQSFLVTCRGKDYDMARAGWNGDYLDANTFLDMWVTNGANNQTGFSSAKYDALIHASADVDEYLAAPPAALATLKDQNAMDQLRGQLAAVASVAEGVEIKKKIRLQLQQEAEAILVQDEFPVVPLYFYVVSGLVRADVRGFYSKLQPQAGGPIPNLLDEHPLRDIWRQQPGGAP
jgi:oligopeptide transport system substrate-binding protein